MSLFLFVLLDVLSVLLTLAVPVLSATALVAVTARVGIGPRTAVALAPLLYEAWLVLFLAASAVETRLAAILHTPREGKLESPHDRRAILEAVVVLHMNRRKLLVTSLPLVDAFFLSPALAPWLKKLVMRAYAPVVHIGTQYQHVSSWLQDPALTYIGDNVVIGYNSELVCHAVNRRGDGQSVYQTAPIVIGSNVVVGGDCRIGMGVRIESNAIVEGGANVLPYTRIGEAEIWRGNPAVFVRMREGWTSAARPTAAAPERADAVAVRALVAKSLGMRTDDVSATLRADDCMTWDSIAKMSIAAALYDRFRIRVPVSDTWKLDSIDAILTVIATSAEAAAGGVDDRQPEADRLDDPELLPLFDAEATTTALARRFQAATDEAVRSVLVAATFTAHPLADTAELWCRAFGVPVKVEFAGFDQIEQALLSPASGFRQNSAGVNVVLARAEDLMRSRDPTGMARAQQIIGAIDTFLENGTGLVVADLPPAISGLADRDPGAVETLRRWWREQLRARPRVHLLEFAALIDEVGRERARDVRSETVAHAPYSPMLFQRLGIAIARVVRGRFVAAKKVVVVDCDNTLWGGVLAEDGVDAIEVGPEPPGRAFQRLQRHLLALKNRGVLLALASKNEEADVWSVFDSHDGMVLRRSDIAAARINWRRKSANLRDLARELNLALDSFVFLDDSATERHEVKMNAPGVTVVPMGDDPAAFAEMLAKLWCFDGLGATAEDASRTQLAAQETARRHAMASSGDLTAFLRSLDVTVEVRTATEHDLPRVAQLTQKTNQFNLSLKRRSLPEVMALRASSLILVSTTRDRFGDDGIVGTAIVNGEADRLVVDTWLISCRALGRGVEAAFLSAMVDLARQMSCATIVAAFREGPRNALARKFLLESGFEDRDDGSLSLRVAAAPPPPSHVRLVRLDVAGTLAALHPGVC